MMKPVYVLTFLSLYSFLLCSGQKGSLYNTSGGMKYTANKGQVSDAKGRPLPSVIYTADLGTNAKTFFFSNSFSYVVLQKEPYQGAPLGVNINPFTEDPLMGNKVNAAQRVDVEFVNSNPLVKVEGNSPLSEISHYYLAHCPDGIHASSFQSITYKELYPGIDMVFKTAQGAIMEYDFILYPGANPENIQLKYTGASGISLHNHVLTIQTISGEIREYIPQIYQQIGSEKKIIKGTYLLKDDVVKFGVGDYDKAYALIIDPWITYITSTVGGHNTTADNSSYAQGLALDTGGNIIVEGYTNSPNFPVTPGVFQDSIAGAIYSTDIFVAKFDTGGNRLWATYYGGSNYEITYPRGIGTDAAGNIIFTSAIRSNDFPVTAGCFQPTYGGGTYDACAVKLTPNGTRIWATYLGGSSDELAMGLFVAPSGNIVTTGTTKSSNFPVSAGAFQATNRSTAYNNAYLIYFDPSGARKWSTYYGGSVTDVGQGINIDKSGNIIMTGTSISADYPVSPGAWQTSHAGPTGLGYGSGDIVLAKFDSTGNRLWATFYGSTGQDAAIDVVTDSAGYIYIVGGSYYSTTFPTTPGVFKPVSEVNGDVVVAKFSPTGSRVWATLIGGTRQEIGRAITLDHQGNIYTCGLTSDTDPYGGKVRNNFPVTSCAYQPEHGGNGWDWWFAKIDPSGSFLCYSSYLGDTSYGSGYSEHCNDIAYQNNTFYMCGYAQGKISIPSNFPVTPGAFQTTPSGTYNQDGVLAAIKIDADSVPVFSAVNRTICAGGSAAFNSTGGVNCNSLPSGTVSYKWYFPGGSPATSIAANPNNIVYNADGNYDVAVVITTPCRTDSLVKPGYIQVSTPVAASISANPESICPNDSSVLMISGNATNIQWQSSTDSVSFNDITGATDTSYIATNLLQATFYRALITGGCGTGFTVSKKVSISTIPSPIISVSDTMICSYDSTRVECSGSYAAYQWNNGDNRPYTYARNAGGVWVTVSDANGCSAESNHQNISVYPVTPISIIVQGDTLSSFNGASYQWYRNDTLIPVAVSAVYVVSQTGYYSVEIMDNNGCYVRSSQVYVAINGLEALSENSLMSIYPNPAHEYVTIKINLDNPQGLLRLYDAVGRLVQSVDAIAEQIIQMYSLTAGIYYLIFQSSSQPAFTMAKKLSKI